MDHRDIGVVLIWVGAILMVAVLQHRLRKGALGEQAFDVTPPIERWAVGIAGTGIALAALGIILVFWSFL
ncbi:hypothetical protein [Magnetospirillum sp. UT-4]|uniref:hypothetical protein n=1 Tax=Magnetospirillum sp. UT-4 TaxID=2681467 RepID=UPI001383E108|nr:hypothetical protein [Magnetospirillum sp. UT-4]CAA7618058.1 conserved hypothetical protein [Magnetospirillum sp. UT-4]